MGVCISTDAIQEHHTSRVTKMPMTLHCMDGSPPNRAVYLCLEALGLKPERKAVNLLAKEHLSPEFTKMNPQHTVPTLDDNGFIIWDSHAICCYLVSKYGKDDSLYPKDLQKRAIVDQRLHFDSGVLFPRLGAIVGSVLFMGSKQITEEQQQKVKEAYGHLEKFLEGRYYLAGDNITVADICCVATVSTLVEALRQPATGFPLVQAWLQRCAASMKGYDNAQKAGLAMIKGAIDKNLG